MKTTRKILALVLCVMLMTAIVPAAYANNPPVEGNPGTGGGDDDPGTTPVPPSATVEKNLIVFVIGYSNCTHTLREQKSARTDTNTCHVHVIGYEGGAQGYVLSGPGWNYDVATTTLTLNNFKGSGIYAQGSPARGEEITLNIKLIGENTITSAHLTEQYLTRHGVYIMYGSLNITGPGSLNIDANDGISALHSAEVPVTMPSGTVRQRAVDGRIIISNGVAINIIAKGNSVMGDELIVNSGCSVVARTTGDFIAVEANHIRCNGTIIGTTAGMFGIRSSYSYYTAGSNVTVFSGANADVATIKTITYSGRETAYGDDVGYLASSNWAPYMAMIEAGWNPTAPPANPLDSASGWAKEGITAAIGKGFVPTDIQDNYTNTITRAEFCRMAVKWLEYRLGKPIDTIVAENGDPARMNHTFSDTTDPNILAAYRLGVTGGTNAPADGKPGTFNPSGQFSREQAATMIRNTARAAGMDVSNVSPAGFNDINTASDWARDGINYVRNAGIMSGTGTADNPLFNPKGNYTREQSIITFNNIQ